MSSDSELKYLRSNTIIEPLVDRFYAWLYTVAPAQAAMNLANLQMPMLESYLHSPQVHVAASNNPELRGGYFVNVEESRAGEIAAVPGVDVLFFGPGDFTILGGFPGQIDHPAVAAAMQQVSDAARRAGKHWGMPCFSVEHGRRLLEMGARFIAHGADIVLLKRGLEQIQQQFGPLGFAFPRKGRPG